MKEIYLTGKYGSKIGNYALVDDDKYDELIKFKWHACRYTDKISNRLTYYAEGLVNGKNIKMHRYICGITDLNIKIEIDHKDGNGLNNQSNNLRVATRLQNVANRYISGVGTSKHKGVSIRKGKFIAQIQSNNKKIVIGAFDNEIDAAIAYDIKAIELFGDFACLNFPETDYTNIEIPLHRRKTSNTGYSNIYYDKNQNIYIVTKVINGIKFRKKSKSLEKAKQYLDNLNENSTNNSCS